MDNQKKVIRNYRNFILVWDHIRDEFNFKFNNKEPKIHFVCSMALTEIAEYVLLHKKDPESFDFEALKAKLLECDIPLEIILRVVIEAKQILDLQSHFYREIDGLRYC